MRATQVSIRLFMFTLQLGNDQYGSGVHKINTRIR